VGNTQTVKPIARTKADVKRTGVAVDGLIVLNNAAANLPRHSNHQG
jgi:hypothetical protein